MSKKLSDYFLEFEAKYSGIKEIDANWYKNELNIVAFCKLSPIKDKRGNFTEEWYRARFIYLLVKSGLYPRENIGVELDFPKGNAGKAIKPDIVVFKYDKWTQDYARHNHEELRKNFLVVFEAKNESDNVAKAIEKQLEVCMERYIGDRVFGIYFDCKEDILILKKISSQSLKRYYFDRSISGLTYLEKLNLSLRDPLKELPSYKDLYDNVVTLSNKSNLHFPDLDPISEDSFPEVLNTLKRQKDQIRPKFEIRDLIVEFLTLKIYDEKTSKANKSSLKFYILPSEIKDTRLAEKTFRQRIFKLYKEAFHDYGNILSRPLFSYDANFRPNDAETERFLIELVKVFQDKAILKGSNENFNQIIFNNFGDSAQKAEGGQFFTPIPVVKTIIEILNPQLNETLCDPCCGICDFPAMAFKHMHKDSKIESVDATNFYGFDKESGILKLAELNLVLNGDGGAILQEMNSISQKYLQSGDISKIGDFSKANYEIENWEHNDDSSLTPNRYKIITTNPPFGKGRDLKTGAKGKWDVAESVIKLYEVYEEKNKKEVMDKNGNKKVKITYPKSLDMGVIFLENAYKLLEDGGRLGIILSNSIASIKEWENIRKWFLTKMRLVATFDLPANTFGETGVATTVIIAYKPIEDEKDMLTENYEVFTREIDEVGYTVKTKKRTIVFRPNYLIDEKTFENTGKIDEDFSKMIIDFHEWLKGQRKELKRAFHIS